VISGIYCIRNIRNIKNGKIYIGSAIDLTSRFSWHRRFLELGKHHSILLQRAYNKYGIDAFEFSIVENVTVKTQLVPREQYWMDYYQSYIPEYGYNVSPTAGSLLGVKMPERGKAYREKLSKALKGIPKSKEHREALSKACRGRVSSNKGRKHSQDTIEKIRHARLGIPLTQETREKLSARFSGKGNPFYGKTHTEETKRANGKRKLGNTNCLGKIPSLLTRKKLSNSQKKRLSDPEVIRRLSNSRKENWKDPNYRKYMEEKFRDPQRCKKISDAKKKLWEIPEFRAKMLLKLKEARAARKLKKDEN